MPDSETATETLALVTLSVRYREAWLEMVADYQAAGETRYDADRLVALDDFPAYVHRLAQNACGENLPPGHVPWTTYFLLKDGQVFLGSTRLRHYLVPDLEIEGGNIGYDIRPSQRRKGYGTRMLALCLDRAWELGLERVMVTCDTSNIASARVIERNGGVLEDYTTSPESGEQVSRYWIALR